jgi:uncharacterized protein YbaR (Trm112 family)
VVLDPAFIELTRCLHTGTRLHLAAPSLLAEINRAVAEGRLKNQLGQAVTQPLDAALVNQSGEWAYAVMDDIPVLLRDQAIDIRQLNDCA